MEEDQNRMMALLSFVNRADSKDFRKKVMKELHLQGSNRVIRGGSWNNNPNNCRSAYRNNISPSNRNNNYGFRLALVLIQIWTDVILEHDAFPAPKNAKPFWGKICQTFASGRLTVDAKVRRRQKLSGLG